MHKYWVYVLNPKTLEEELIWKGNNLEEAYADWLDQLGFCFRVRVFG